MLHRPPHRQKARAVRPPVWFRSALSGGPVHSDPFAMTRASRATYCGTDRHSPTPSTPPIPAQDPSGVCVSSDMGDNMKLRVAHRGVTWAAFGKPPWGTPGHSTGQGVAVVVRGHRFRLVRFAKIAVATVPASGFARAISIVNTRRFH